MPSSTESKNSPAYEQLIKAGLGSSMDGCPLDFEHIPRSLPEGDACCGMAPPLLVGMDENEPPLAPPVKSIVVFDWDDTLLSSSFLAAQGYRVEGETPASPFDTHLQQLDCAARALIELALAHADHVCVITNAETGWVELSSQKWLPGVHSILHQLKIVSARSTYECEHPDSPLQWKVRAFQERLLNEAHPSHDLHVISFGDSHVERQAVHTVTSGLSNARTKSVKFAERPTLEQLRCQLITVTSCFSYICQHEGDLDLMLTVAEAAPPS